jgi:hypothetical protein
MIATILLTALVVEAIVCLGAVVWLVKKGQ